MKSRIIILVLLVIAGCFSCYFFLKGDSDASKFREEYESYNGKTWEGDGVSGRYHNLDIPKDNPVVYLNDENILEEIGKGNKIIYFGFADCNWCRAALPVLLDTFYDNGVMELYYYNFKNIRTAFDEGLNDESAKTYEKLFSKINSDLKKSKLDKIDRLVAPTVVLVENGVVTNIHVGTVESHTSYGKKLNSKQKNELGKIYEDMVLSLIMCNENC